MRDSAIFYRSFYDAVKDLPADVQADVYKAMCEYAYYQNEIELTGTAKAIFTLIKPQFDANFKKYENGKKGGRPPKNANQEETKVKPDLNQEETKEKPNLNQEESKEKGNVNESSNVSLNVSSNKNVDVDENAEVSLHANYDYFVQNKKVVKAFMNDFKVNEEGLFKKLKAYHLHLEKLNVSSKSPQDYRSHLNNWLKKTENAKKLEEEANRIRNGGNTSEDVNRRYGIRSA